MQAGIREGVRQFSCAPVPGVAYLDDRVTYLLGFGETRGFGVGFVPRCKKPQTVPNAALLSSGTVEIDEDEPSSSPITIVRFYVRCPQDVEVFDADVTVAQ